MLLRALDSLQNKYIQVQTDDQWDFMSLILSSKSNFQVYLSITETINEKNNNSITFYIENQAKEPSKTS